ncbi:unnamed protein product, partial [Scytosiphon promiscuus]
MGWCVAGNGVVDVRRSLFRSRPRSLAPARRGQDGRDTIAGTVRFRLRRLLQPGVAWLTMSDRLPEPNSRLYGETDECWSASAGHSFRGFGVVTVMAIVVGVLLKPTDRGVFFASAR